MAREQIDQSQSLIRALEAQRNGALNQVAQLQIALDDNAHEIAELKAEVEALTPAKPEKKNGAR